MEDLLTRPAIEGSYRRQLELGASPMDVTKAIARVRDWWSIHTSGDSDGEGKIFTVRFSAGASETFVEFRIDEFVPGNRIVWQVTNCFLPWLADKSEWTGTRVIFDLSAGGGGTALDFTHEGLVPQVECYAGCVKGWDQYILGSLRQLVETGTGKPN